MTTTQASTMDDPVVSTAVESSDHVISQGTKPHSTPLTLQWLEHNYSLAQGVCIARSELYLHYRTFCRLTNTSPVNAASFGKIIRQQFPQITTRRLGTRGQSKYHYYGIGVRPSLGCVGISSSTPGRQLQRPHVHDHSDDTQTSQNQVASHAPKACVPVSLPSFPDISIMKLPADIDTHKVARLLEMYHAHCQQILDTRGHSEQFLSCAFYFWQGMPTDILPILHKHIIVRMLGVCDSILYKALADVLMPTAVHTPPDSCSHVTRSLAHELEAGLTRALFGLPTSLQSHKLDVARRFAQTLRRQTSLGHLVQASRAVLTAPDTVRQLRAGWAGLDLSDIARQTLCSVQDYSDRQHSLVLGLCADFERLLEQQAQVEGHLCWLDNLVHCCVVKVSQKRGDSLRSTARQFLLVWSCFGTRVIRDMTLQNAPSFASFHLLHLLFDDYVLYLIESLHGDERLKDMMHILKGEVAEKDHSGDVILPDASQVKDVYLGQLRSGQGHIRSQKLGEQSVGGYTCRDKAYLDDEGGNDECSGEDEYVEELTDDECPSASGHGRPADVCVRAPAQSRVREQTLNHYTSQQQQLPPEQRSAGNWQDNDSSQQWPTPHSGRSHAPYQVGSLPHSHHSNRTYVVPNQHHSCQSSWSFQSHDMDADVSRRDFLMPASFPPDTAYQNPSLGSSMPGGTMSQLPYEIGKSCQQNLAVFTNMGYHDYQNVPQQVMASLHSNSPTQTHKHEAGPEQGLRFKHPQLLKRPRHQGLSGLQHCGMDLL